MTVVSISLDEQLLDELEEIEDEAGFSGRSEVIRTALRSFISNREDLSDLKGNKTAIMAVRHDEDADLEVHGSQDLIDAQLHSHDHEGGCLQIFVLQGEASEIIALKEDLESRRKVYMADLISF